MAGNDVVWRKLYKRAIEMRTLKARVGVLASKGGMRSAGDSGLTLVELAAIHEFGSADGHIPERSFIRSTFYERAAAELREMCGKITKAIVLGAVDVRQGIGMLGAWGAAQVKNTITQTDIPPPLAPSTIAAKGSSKPLVDTGQMLNAITWEVIDTREGRK
jgi:hypothetical protein